MRNKACAKCGSIKPANLKNFIPHHNCRDGVGPYCRPCFRKISKAHKLKNRDRLVLRRRELYAIKNGPIQRQKNLDRYLTEPLAKAASVMCGGLRARSRLNGLFLDVRLRKTSFVIAWLKRQPRCECCHQRFYLGPKNGMKNDLSPSFDQMVIGRGYRLSNTALVCWRCNNIKRNYDASDLRMVADWMSRRGLR